MYDAIYAIKIMFHSHFYMSPSILLIMILKLFATHLYLPANVLLTVTQQVPKQI
jgi:hypothetical protein